MQDIYQSFFDAKTYGKKHLAVLIDPDRYKLNHIEQIIQLVEDAKVSYIFLGGSLIINDMLNACVTMLKKELTVPVVLFPGSTYQIHHQADAILFLSLISGRNPELLIGKHVIAAPYLKKSPLEVISTGYMLVDGGKPTTATYISHSFPIPNHKDEIAVSTAIAGELLGMKTIYMDAGSGAHIPISSSMIQAVSSHIDIPLIVGGGIRTPEQAAASTQAGADIIVVGNAIEKNPTLVIDISSAVYANSFIQHK